MTAWHGPGYPFTVLFEESTEQGSSLPEEVQGIYGDWRIPSVDDMPFVYVNFVMSHDGRVSFNLPGAAGGGEVSANNAHDQWLMGLLRARADAVLVGDNTLRTEPEHRWTAEAIYPPDAAAFAALRRTESRAAIPLMVFASFDGNIHADAAIFRMEDTRIVIATTTAGVERAHALLGNHPRVECLAFGDEAVDLPALLRLLYSRYEVRALLCEGGPTLHGSLLAAGMLNEEFLTLSPRILGNPRGAPPRPGLVEGIGFLPATAPAIRLVSVRRAGNFLFLRSQYR